MKNKQAIFPDMPGDELEKGLLYLKLTHMSAHYKPEADEAAQKATLPHRIPPVARSGRGRRPAS